MTPKTHDPLLAAAKVVITISQVLLTLAAVGLGLASIAMVTLGHGQMFAEMTKADIPPLGGYFIAAAMATGAVMAFLGFRFLKELRGIIDSVGEGESFRPENADRLSRMGWIAVAIQVMVVPIGALAVWLTPYLDKADAKMHIDGFDGSAILLTLVLFILARVFREGTRMREELEGTV